MIRVAACKRNILRLIRRRRRWWWRLPRDGDSLLYRLSNADDEESIVNFGPLRYSVEQFQLRPFSNFALGTLFGK
jgi:hypothetical protein